MKLTPILLHLRDRHGGHYRAIGRGQYPAQPERLHESEHDLWPQDHLRKDRSHS